MEHLPDKKTLFSEEDMIYEQTLTIPAAASQIQRDRMDTSSAPKDWDGNTQARWITSILWLIPALIYFIQALIVYLNSPPGDLSWVGKVSAGLIWTAASAVNYLVFLACDRRRDQERPWGRKLRTAVVTLVALGAACGVILSCIYFFVPHHPVVPEDVHTVTISLLQNEEQITCSDPSEIKMIGTYLENLNLKHAKISADSTQPYVWTITLYSSNQTSSYLLDVTDRGTETLRMDGKWYDISEEQWGKWDALLEELRK